MSSIMYGIYTVISWIMLRWHGLWDGLGVGVWLSTNWDWVLAIVFLVLTIRGLLFPVFVKQIKSQRAMQAIQPKMAELKDKHKGDRAGLQQAQMELMRSENANPLMGCLPMLVQGPVFLGLFHVLRHLKPSMPPQLQTLYGWTQTQFESASHARLFGAPIASSMRSSAFDLHALGATALNVRIVAGVLVAIMIVTTYMTSRQMILKTGWATDPTQLMMQRLMVYGIPLGLLFSGTIFPIGVVIYWVTTNLFSLGQQFYVLRKYPPPPATANLGLGLGSTSRPSVNGKVVNGKVVDGKVVDGGRRNGKVKDANVAPAVTPKVVAPKVGAKPVNPKKGNAPKRNP